MTNDTKSHISYPNKNGLSILADMRYSLNLELGVMVIASVIDQ